MFKYQKVYQKKMDRETYIQRKHLYYSLLDFIGGMKRKAIETAPPRSIKKLKPTIEKPKKPTMDVRRHRSMSDSSMSDNNLTHPDIPEPQDLINEIRLFGDRKDIVKRCIPLISKYSINYKQNVNDTPLTLSLKQKRLNLELIKTLVENGAYIRDCLYVAIQRYIVAYDSEEMPPFQEVFFEELFSKYSSSDDDDEYDDEYECNAVLDFLLSKGAAFDYKDGMQTWATLKDLKEHFYNLSNTESGSTADSDVLYKLALITLPEFHVGVHEKSIDYLFRSANLGNADAKLLLFKMMEIRNRPIWHGHYDYETMMGLDSNTDDEAIYDEDDKLYDPKATLRWKHITESAKAGNPYAQYELALIYHKLAFIYHKEFNNSYLYWMRNSAANNFVDAIKHLSTRQMMDPEKVILLDRLIQNGDLYSLAELLPIVNDLNIIDSIMKKSMKYELINVLLLIARSYIDIDTSQAIKLYKEVVMNEKSGLNDKYKASKGLMLCYKKLNHRKTYFYWVYKMQCIYDDYDDYDDDDDDEALHINFYNSFKDKMDFYDFILLVIKNDNQINLKPFRNILKEKSILLLIYCILLSPSSTDNETKKNLQQKFSDHVQNIVKGSCDMTKLTDKKKVSLYNDRYNCYQSLSSNGVIKNAGVAFEEAAVDYTPQKAFCYYLRNSKSKFVHVLPRAVADAVSAFFNLVTTTNHVHLANFVEINSDMSDLAYELLIFYFYFQTFTSFECLLLPEIRNKLDLSPESYLNAFSELYNVITHDVLQLNDELKEALLKESV